MWEGKIHLKGLAHLRYECDQPVSRRKEEPLAEAGAPSSYRVRDGALIQHVNGAVWSSGFQEDVIVAPRGASIHMINMAPDA